MRVRAPEGRRGQDQPSTTGCGRWTCWTAAQPMEDEHGERLRPAEAPAARKDEEELGFMREASRLVDEVVRMLRGCVRPGMTERQVAKQIPEFFEEAGADAPSFSPIVASGPNGSMPHYGGGLRTIEENDVIIIDLGGRHRSYCSDTTRTFFGRRPPSRGSVRDRAREQAARQAAVHPEATGRTWTGRPRKVAVDARYGLKYFQPRGARDRDSGSRRTHIIEGTTRHGAEECVQRGRHLPAAGFGVRMRTGRDEPTAPGSPEQVRGRSSH